MATALLTIYSLSHPVRAISRWFSRGVFAAKAHVRALDSQPRHMTPAHEVARMRPMPAPVPGAVAVARSSADSSLASHWGDVPAANGERFSEGERVTHAVPAASARTVRVLHRTDGSGPMRLVISGRMADVCAELDRLVAREAAHG
ncbi:MAG: hypothetical protein EOO31_06955 [Comamonadaceae bacterium]|nr:MAG: hypothetical protein EOO31_06955 [Comamonadaceae bacterium]